LVLVYHKPKTMPILFYNFHHQLIRITIIKILSKYFESSKLFLKFVLEKQSPHKETI
jgi:hypothetical protein